MFCHGKFTVLYSANCKGGIRTYKRIAFSVSSNEGAMKDNGMEEPCNKSVVSKVSVPEHMPRGRSQSDLGLPRVKF